MVTDWKFECLNQLQLNQIGNRINLNNPFAILIDIESIEVGINWYNFQLGMWRIAELII